MKTSSLKVAAVCGILLAACSTSPQGRKQILAPEEVSKAYSEADLRIQLATASSVAAPCAGADCTLNQQFDQRVQEQGGRLAMAAFDLYPDLIQRVSAFQFEVVEKAVPGMSSNAAGKIVVLRGVQGMELDDASLAFLMAREMGHVIAKHHEENSGTRILLSIAAGVLFPALNLFNGSAQVAQQATQITSASAIGTTVASTATSYLGSKAILASLKPDQLSEADTIALALAEREGWHLHDIASLFEKADRVSNGASWGEDLHLTVANLRKIDMDMQSTDLSQQPIALGVQRECRALEEGEEAGPNDADVAVEPGAEPAPEIPVMVAELTPPPANPEPATPSAEPAKVNALAVAEQAPPVEAVEAPLPQLVAPALAAAAQPEKPVPGVRTSKRWQKTKPAGVASKKVQAKTEKSKRVVAAKKTAATKKAPLKGAVKPRTGASQALKPGKLRSGTVNAASKAKPAPVKKPEPMKP